MAQLDVLIRIWSLAWPLPVLASLVLPTHAVLAEPSMASISGSPLPGAYRSAPARHPFVFTSPARMNALVTAHTPITDAALRRLEAIAGRIVQNQDRYAQTYSGCDIEEYNKRFAAGGDSAVVVVTWLATYAYLASLDAGYGDKALAARAVASAKTIMLSWVRTGFRIDGSFVHDPHMFCSKTPAANRIANALVSLLVGRSMPYWVQSQDLLTAVEAFNPQETGELSQFLTQMESLLKEAAREKAQHDAALECGKYDNQTIQNLLGLLAIARFRNDGAGVAAVAQGSSEIAVTWPEQLEGSIYGVNDSVRGCYAAVESNAHYYFQIPTVASGEIIDRYRAVTYQPFGYTLGALENLLLSARLLQESGFSAVNYTGKKGQSLLSSLQYYSYYFTRFLDTSATVLPTGPDPYPSYEQYSGHPVSRAGGATVDGRDDLLAPFLLGYQLYRNDPRVKGVLERALSFVGGGVVPLMGVDAFALDSLPLLAQLKATRNPSSR